jgi:hypothetical protein
MNDYQTEMIWKVEVDVDMKSSKLLWISVSLKKRRRVVESLAGFLAG